jgi:hypothetical protein
MPLTISGKPVKFIAIVKGAREVTLVGSAEYDYWADRLLYENLVPQKVDGRAEVILSAVQLKWMGVSFREFSVSISVRDRAEPSIDGIYLFSAFSTSRLLACIEKYHFRTPYYHSNIDVSVQNPWSLQLFDGVTPVIQSERHDASDVERCDETWEARIFLPNGARGSKPSNQLFFAKLSGATQVARFSASSDSLALTPSNQHAVVQSLVDSGFTGREWRVRSNATHARSRTYRRDVG